VHWGCICTVPWQTQKQPLQENRTNRERLTNRGEGPLEHYKTSPCKHLSVRRHRHLLCIAFIDTNMLISTLWGAFGSLIGLFYAGVQVMVPCLPPAPLSASVFTTDEVRGFNPLTSLLHASCRLLYSDYFLSWTKSGKYCAVCFTGLVFSFSSSPSSVSRYSVDSLMYRK